MEFSYRVSEADYMAAWRLRRRQFSRGEQTALWVIILVYVVFILGMILQFWLIRRNGTPIGGTAGMFGPFVSFGGICGILVVFGAAQTRARRQYRADPTMQGQFKVAVTADGISISNTAGPSSKWVWNNSDRSRQAKDLIVVESISGAYTILNLAGLSPQLRAELRNILAAALPKK
jgi:hypothetical protein